MTNSSARSAAVLAPAEEQPRHHPQPVIRVEGERRLIMIVSQFNDDLLSLLKRLDHTDWVIYWWANCADAMATLRSNVVPVIVCDRDLPDGNWRTLLAQVKSLAEPPRFILTARLADEKLWADALNLGAYDLLGKPLDAEEVLRVIGSAYCSWRSRREEKRTNSKLRKRG